MLAQIGFLKNGYIKLSKTYWLPEKIKKDKIIIISYGIRTDKETIWLSMYYDKVDGMSFLYHNLENNSNRLKYWNQVLNK